MGEGVLSGGWSEAPVTDVVNLVWVLALAYVVVLGVVVGAGVWQRVRTRRPRRTGHRAVVPRVGVIVPGAGLVGVGGGRE